MKLKQSTRILILLALIVAAVAVWYSLFFASKQPEPTVEAVTTIPRKTERVAARKPVAVTTSARALQVLPIPFLVTEAPEEAPLEPAKNEVAIAIANTNVPPNPFVPLRVKPSKQAQPEKPKQVPESEKPVLVTPSTELAPNIPVPKTITPEGGPATPPPVATLGQGTLPIKLNPLDREVTSVEPLATALAETEVEENPAGESASGGGNISKATAPENTGEASEEVQPEQATEEATQVEEEEPTQPPPPNPLEVWARQQQLRLDGVALGPVGVAIFETASGYLALPVGQTFPNDNVLVKTITADRVLLVDDSGTNTLTLELGGGE